MKGRVREAVLVIAAAAALTVALTYPLAFEAGSAGRVRINDGRWSIWATAWVARAFTTTPLHLYDANIFHPRPAALAYSEANLGAGLIAAPAWLLTGNPILAHNVAVLVSFVLSALATYYLARYLTGLRAAAATAAVIFAFCPYVFAHTAHIQLLMTAGLPLTLLAMHAYVERPSLARGLIVGLVVAAQALSCGYYGIFAAALAGLGLVYFGVSRSLWRDRVYWAGALGGAATSIALLLPFFLPYLQLQEDSGFARTLDDARRYSATWRSYLASASWAHRWLLPALGNFKEPLMPGAVAIMFGTAGMSLVIRRGQAATSRRDVPGFYLLLAALAFWLSLGPDGVLYTVLYDWLPIFSFLRAPSRIGAVVTLALAVLSAFGVAAIARSRGAGTRVALSVLPLIAAAELTVAPLKLDRMPPVPGVYRMLATLPPGAVAEFPFYADPHDVQFNALYMLFSTYHWQRLVNGYSDNFPPDFFSFAQRLRTFPSAETLDLLKGRGTRYIVVHLSRYAEDQRLAVIKGMTPLDGRVRLLLRQDTVELYEIVR